MSPERAVLAHSRRLCLNNLYGVDLMDEAPEIAKLRLFLKLAAQIDDKRHLVEPLPDLDFNIKAGNLLVGIADEHGRCNARLERGPVRFWRGEIAEDHDSWLRRVADDLRRLHRQAIQGHGDLSDHASD